MLARVRGRSAFVLNRRHAGPREAPRRVKGTVRRVCALCTYRSVPVLGARGEGFVIFLLCADSPFCACPSFRSRCGCLQVPSGSVPFVPRVNRRRREPLRPPARSVSSVHLPRIGCFAELRDEQGVRQRLSSCGPHSGADATAGQGLVPTPRAAKERCAWWAGPHLDLRLWWLIVPRGEDGSAPVCSLISSCLTYIPWHSVLSPCVLP